MLDVVARFGAAQKVTEFAHGGAGLFELGLEPRSRRITCACGIWSSV